MLSKPELSEIVEKIKALSDYGVLQELLHITDNTNETELVRSFRKKTVYFHPDKYQSAEEKELANIIFIRLETAKNAFLQQRGRTYTDRAQSDLKEPIRSELLRHHNLFWVSRLTNAGISLEELIALDPTFRARILNGVLYREVFQIF